MTNTVQHLLRENGIKLPHHGLGEQATTCPRCSHDRKKEHQKIKCLGVKIDDKGVVWGCNHCGWSGGTGNNGQTYDAVYDFVDANSKLLWQKLRNPPGSKSKFTQRRPDGNSGCIWKDVRKGLPSVLYHLPEVIAALKDGRLIIVVEGEKDADNLRALGVLATCSPDGAAKPGQKP